MQVGDRVIVETHLADLPWGRTHEGVIIDEAISFVRIKYTVQKMWIFKFHYTEWVRKTQVVDVINRPIDIKKVADKFGIKLQ